MAAPSDPTAVYRGQQGMAPVTHSYDPTVVGWIVDAARRHGADPAAMIATSLQENGARAGLTPGDNGHSFGYFQMNDKGALAGHSPQWATTAAVADNRAREFARLQVHGGKGAAAVQRPADPNLYAQGVDNLMAQARAILQHFHGIPDHQGHEPADEGPHLVAALRRMSAAGPPTANPVQSALDANAEIAGVTAPRLPLIYAPAAPTSSPTATPATPRMTAPPPPAAPSSFAPSTTTSHKAGKFEGTTVAAWMIPALTFARQNGWKGKLTSGVRSTALQAQLYARYQAGGNVAAKPGQSNHELQNGGAFDATDAPQLAQILKSFKGQRPVWAPTVGLNDTPHFSLTGR